MRDTIQGMTQVGFDAQATLFEEQLDGSLWLSLHPRFLPKPGQYLFAWNPAQPWEPLPVALFPAGIRWLRQAEEITGSAGEVTGVRVLGNSSPAWRIGSELRLRGPLGQGFHLPPETQRLALVSLSSTVLRLLPLVYPALENGSAIALFSDQPLPQLPLEVEAYPLEALPELRDWADFWALDIPVDRLNQVSAVFGLPTYTKLTAPAQALVNIPMPCGGTAACGVCTVNGRYANFLACGDGPVLSLDRLLK
jgi:dihydroorotate dehydrogenase electron transfer subunit